jgi:hypothetical protein
MKITPIKNYKKYVQIQQECNAKKLKEMPDRHSVSLKEIGMIVEYMLNVIPEIKFGICHGVRNGWEVREFSTLLPLCHIIGTDLGIESGRFPNVIQWDFHNMKEEWINSVDFIFSNSLDHSYDPMYAIHTWMRCVRTTGRLFVEWSKLHDECGIIEKRGDIFGATKSEYREMFNRYYEVEKEINITDTSKIPKYIFIVKHRKNR